MAQRYTDDYNVLRCPRCRKRMNEKDPLVADREGKVGCEACAAKLRLLALQQTQRSEAK